MRKRTILNFALICDFLKIFNPQKVPQKVTIFRLPPGSARCGHKFARTAERRICTLSAGRARPNTPKGRGLNPDLVHCESEYGTAEYPCRMSDSEAAVSARTERKHGLFCQRPCLQNTQKSISTPPRRRPGTNLGDCIVQHKRSTPVGDCSTQHKHSICVCRLSFFISERVMSNHGVLKRHKQRTVH